ncbi:MAG TPA: sugar-binding domain-containing protein [Ktedonobacteraceae bacterium]|nr:sugar-binding domain-containing protein [Ktedonobacteraceae bacterium]
MSEILQGNGTEARLLTDERFLRKVAYSYYEDGHSQEAIAAMEFCSRQMVSKALQKARERGIVRIAVVPDLRTGYLRNLAREVRLELGLDDLVLVAGQSMDTVDANAVLDEVVIEITNAAAEYLDQLLTDEDILAVSGGTTFMRNLVRYIKPTRLLPHLRVVATIGFANAHTNFGDANLIAHDLAQAYGAIHHWFPCPAFMPDEQQMQQARQLPIVKEAYELMAQASVTVTGIWTPQSNEEMVQHGVLSREQFEAIEAYQPTADINHWIFDADGRCINDVLAPPPYFLSGLEIPRLKHKIRQSGAKVMLVAGGSPSYIPAIRSVLKAGLANILVTDHVTAQLLLLHT